MVRTRSSNPEVVLPDFTTRVTPPRRDRTSISLHSRSSSDSSSSQSSFHSVPDLVAMSGDKHRSDANVPGSFPSALANLSSLFSSSPRRSNGRTPPLDPQPMRPANSRIHFAEDQNVSLPLPLSSSASQPPLPSSSTLKADDPPSSGVFDDLSSPLAKGKDRVVEADSPGPSPRVPSSFQDAKGDSGAVDDLLAQLLGDSRVKGMDNSMLKLLLLKNLMAVNNQTNPLNSSASVASQLKWQSLGANVKPSLAVDGSNFPLWSASLKDLVLGVTQVDNYFKHDRFEDDVPTALGVLAVIKNSIDEALSSSLNGMNAYGAWISLYERFSGPSWSLLLSRWSDIAQAPDASDSISSSYESLKRSLLDMEERLGGWTTDKLLSLTFNSSIHRYRNQVADTMDS
ncbi:uncharacterized protein PGTG_21162 [Puccinia graminis f. sp. tritici CRL 75-36-700-3]|uniref:Uncharacterized protein n=1 Tax=Puccinia graminis f. sp. tritici (strain CRL 75-36-700-3 / race SCCL) TaxID=418459 RepID=H6QQK2_PUCGT|nr:uncharacterized protein PGTG_21162 [Puccinia graminis f. sp. tritici CRL 75-36-700-3]EHS62654.1 hypothetical protein PGTG_21162 [Puccinia graminis f. sp. tritici CRL 75-36-700-3]